MLKENYNMSQLEQNLKKIQIKIIYKKHNYEIS